MTRLFHPERLAGVCAELRAFFDEWAKTGPFPLTIDKDGGLRADAKHQAELYAAGRTHAPTLDLTPHGRGGAVDAYPAVVVGGAVAGILLPTGNEDAVARFREYGLAAEKAGLRWGGRWLEQFPPWGDAPHVEVLNWADLPFPPPLVTPYP